ncbi:MAG: pyrroline-5-carboxylate reductase [Planctomycetota bacterium]|nr:MAG: pyrroline-5-carboxylate reductase [Planctomycetota bacterium]
MQQKSIGFIGAGQMARALAAGFVKAGLAEPTAVLAADPSSEALNAFTQSVAGAKTVGDNASLAEQAEVIVLATKPQHLASAIAPMVKAAAGKLVVSIAAGVKLATLEKSLGKARLVRVMPNTPCLVGESASGYCLGPRATQDDAALVKQLLESVGIAFEVDEPLLDAVTGLSGSGPAFAYVMIEALADGGVAMGLKRDVALALAAQTLRGAAQMVLETGEHPGVLKDRVASPGGTTIAGLEALEAGKLRGTLINAVQSATRRSIELGRV